MEKKLPDGWKHESSSSFSGIFIYQDDVEVTIIKDGGVRLLSLSNYDANCEIYFFDIQQFAKDVKAVHKLYFE